MHIAGSSRLPGPARPGYGLPPATFNATTTDTIPGLIADLLDRASDDPITAVATATSGAPDQAPDLRETLPNLVLARGAGADS